MKQVIAVLLGISILSIYLDASAARVYRGGAVVTSPRLGVDHRARYPEPQIRARVVPAPVVRVRRRSAADYGF